MVATIGTRAQVMRGTALKTSGGLTKKDLKMNAAGAIVSKKQSSRAKRTESPLLKMWRDSVKEVYKDPKYRGRFIKIKRGTAFYKAVYKAYQIRKAKLGKRATPKTKKSPKKKRKC